MAVNWGLAGGGGFDYLASLQALGQEASRRQNIATQQHADSQRAYAFDQLRRQDTARVGIGDKVRAGDFAGAREDAVLGGDFDFARAIDGVHDDHLAQLGREFDTIGLLHPQLKALPVEQRAATAIPILKQAGFSDAELANADWSDAGIDAAYSMSATGKAALLARQQAAIKAAEPYTLNPGDQRYSGGTVIAENPYEKPIWDSESGTIIYPSQMGRGSGFAGPGGTAAPTTATGGRYQFGWTPRARNGGDNTDAAVDNKIAGMAQALGVGPDDDISRLSPRQIANALALSEGGAGSLADRNNNPGNLRDPKTGAYRQFAAKNDGLNAAASQVLRNLRRGQTTIRTMVEGLPVGGRSGGGDTPGVVQVRPAKAKGGNAPSGYRYAADGTSLEPIPGGPADPNTSTQRNVQSNRTAEANFRKEFDGLAEVKTFKAARQQFSTLRDLGAKANPTPQDDIAMIFTYMKTLDPSSVVREGEFATAQNATGVSEALRNQYNKVLSGNRLNPQQRQQMVRTAYANYKNYRDAYNTSAENYRGYARDNGINPDRVARTYTPDKPRAAPSGRMSQFKIVKVN